jgi:hypothetical protein
VTVDLRTAATAPALEPVATDRSAYAQGAGSAARRRRSPTPWKPNSSASGGCSSPSATGSPDPGQDCRQVPITGIAAEGRAVFGPWGLRLQGVKSRQIARSSSERLNGPAIPSIRSLWTRSRPSRARRFASASSR